MELAVYGIEGQGWFLNRHCFTNYVKVAVLPRHVAASCAPGESRHKHVRYLDIREDDRFDEAQFAVRMKQTRSARLSHSTSRKERSSWHDARRD